HRVEGLPRARRLGDARDPLVRAPDPRGGALGRHPAGQARLVVEDGAVELPVLTVDAEAVAQLELPDRLDLQQILHPRDGHLVLLRSPPVTVTGRPPAGAIRRAGTRSGRR